MIHTLSAIIKRVARLGLEGMGYGIYRLSAEERLSRISERASTRPSLESMFGDDLSKLQDLRERYAKVDLPIARHSTWASKHAAGSRVNIGWGGVDLCSFRGHSAYVWAYLPANPLLAKLKYYIFADAVRQKDAAGLLNVLHEDGDFGCSTFSFPGLGTVSRDLLDSVLELNFLNQHLNIMSRNNLRVLDIGAGYGRMAHRMLEAKPTLQSYTCVDAVPESTFLCQFYLRHRGLESRVQVVPMDELEQRLECDGYDLALNIHSFSECTYAAVEWWLRKLQALRVRYLMLVPNGSAGMICQDTDGSTRDFGPLLAEAGYELVARDPVFSDLAVQEIMNVRESMYLYENRDLRSGQR